MLYICPQCSTPYVSNDELVVDARAHLCPHCYGKKLLRDWGLGEDFLERGFVR